MPAVSITASCREPTEPLHQRYCAQPITLIDGERLLDLLIENEIGIRKKPIDLYEIDDSYFEEPLRHGGEEAELPPIEVV